MRAIAEPPEVPYHRAIKRAGERRFSSHRPLEGAPQHGVGVFILARGLETHRFAAPSSQGRGALSPNRS
jgi:hypothetical protein